MKSFARTLLPVLAAGGTLLGLWSLTTVGAATPTPRATYATVASIDSDDDFEIRRYNLDLVELGGLDPTVGVRDAEGVLDMVHGAAVLAELPGVIVELEGSPEIVVLDTFDVEGSFVLRSRNGGEWGDWIELEVPVDEAPDGVAGEEGARGLSAIGPVWIGDDAEALEIVAIAGAVANLGVESWQIRQPDHQAEGEVEVDSLDVPPDQGEHDEGPFGAAVVGSATAPRPTIRPRSDWASGGWVSANDGCGSAPSVAPNVNAAIVHHTVTANEYSAAQVPDILRSIYRFHTVTNGWCDIAYNFIVDRFGTIWEARSGGIERPVIGGHARGFNTGTVGVSLLGNYQVASVPAAAQNAVRNLVGWKLGLHGVDPRGTVWLQNRATGSGMKFGANQWVELPTIIGHRDVGLTSCPGANAQPMTSQMRSALAPVGQQVGAAPYQFPAWRAAPSGPAIVTVDSAGGVRPAVAAGVVDPAPSVGAGAVAIAGWRPGGTETPRGYVLAGNGTLRPFGGAPAVAGTPGGGTVVDLAVASGGAGGWILAADGTVSAFGGAPARSAAGKPATATAVALALDGAGNGYVVDRAGNLYAVGSAPAAVAVGRGTTVDVALRPDGRSGWVLDSNMTLHAFGGAPTVSVVGANRSAPRAVLSSPTGFGGWVLDSQGRLLTFGQVPHAVGVSTHVGHDIGVDATLVDYLLAPSPAGTTNGRYVTALYRTFIGSAPSPLMLDHWMWRLREVGSPAIVRELAASDEWAGAVVDDIYGTALGRLPDAEGRRYWVEQLRRGMRVQDLGTYFYGSNEYFQSAGSAEAYVRRLYGELLHRSPDSAGLTYWVGQLNRGARPDQVAAGFYASLESRRDRVARLFERVLGRGPDPAGHEHWTGWLVRGDDIGLAAELAGSEEYFLRATG